MKIEKKKIDIDLFEKACNQNGIHFDRGRNVNKEVKIIDSKGRVLTIKNGKKPPHRTNSINAIVPASIRGKRDLELETLEIDNIMSRAAMKRKSLRLGGKKVGIAARRKSRIKRQK